MADGDDTISLTTLNDKLANVAASPQVVNDWNGTLGTVDLAKPKDYTGDLGKIVGTNGNFNLRSTMHYYMWIAQGKPEAATPVTQEHINTAVPLFREVIARYRIYKLFNMANVQLRYRASDLVREDFVADGVKAERAVRELYALLTTGAAMEEKIATAGMWVLNSLVANAIHREQNDDHSWFTPELDNPRSPTSKTLAVAGRRSKEFKVYMTQRGHDGNHHLSTATLDSMARIIAGDDQATAIPGPGPTQYAGRDITDIPLAQVLDIGEAAKGRYPAGVLGKAAIIIGLGMFRAMITHLSSRVKLEGIVEITRNTELIENAVTRSAYTHTVLLAIGSALGKQFAVCYGFLTKSHILRGEEYKAFENHAKRYPAEIAIGESLATALRRAAPHREAITGSIVSILTSMAEALRAAAATNTGVAGAAVVQLDPGAPPADIRAEVGAIGGGGGTVFYDADED